MLQIDSIPVYGPAILQDHITSHFKNLLGTSDPRLLTLQLDIWNTSEKLTLEQQNFLECPFTLEEIRSTLFSCNPSKTPGPDGISFLFYQTYWDLVQADLKLLVQSFYYRTLDLCKLNLASICLIPKKADASNISNSDQLV